MHSAARIFCAGIRPIAGNKPQIQLPMKSSFDSPNNGNGSLSRNGHSNGNGNGNGKWHPPEKQDVDFLPFVEILLRHMPLLLMGGVALGIIGVLVGAFFWRPNFSAGAQLVAYDS